MTKPKKGMPEIVGDVYTLLEPLQSEDRKRVVASVLTLLGEESVARSTVKEEMPRVTPGEGTFGQKANRWMSSHGISVAAIEEVFHRDGDKVEVIASQIPGGGKRGQTHNCYLLSGIRSLLETDEAKFSEAEAVMLCKNMGCHDAGNHAKSRSELGNNVAGTKNSGFTLPAPGLRAAAALVKQMSTPS